MGEEYVVLDGIKYTERELRKIIKEYAAQHFLEGKKVEVTEETLSEIKANLGI